MGMQGKKQNKLRNYRMNCEGVAKNIGKINLNALS